MLKDRKLRFLLLATLGLLAFSIGTYGTATNNTALYKKFDEHQQKNEKAHVTGLRYNNVHVLDLEKSMILYEDILGFQHVDTEYLKGNLEGMRVLKMKANDFMIALSVVPEKMRSTLGPIGNTNHNHFMLIVNNIGPIGDRLKLEGYELENDNYVQDKYTFFTGPNGEIIGLSSWVD